MDNIPEFFKVGSTKNIFNYIINECLKYDIITVQKGGGGEKGGIHDVINKLIFSELLFNQFGGKSVKKWTTFSHNGVLFPEPYQAHGIPLIYGTNKEKIYLDPESEEYATIYSKFVDTEYVKNKLFKQNFFGDWKKYLKKGGFNQVVS